MSCNCSKFGSSQHPKSRSSAPKYIHNFVRTSSVEANKVILLKPIVNLASGLRSFFQMSQLSTICVMCVVWQKPTEGWGSIVRIIIDWEIHARFPLTLPLHRNSIAVTITPGHRLGCSIWICSIYFGVQASRSVFFYRLFFYTTKNHPFSYTTNVVLIPRAPPQRNSSRPGNP